MVMWALTPTVRCSISGSTEGDAGWMGELLGIGPDPTSELKGRIGLLRDGGAGTCPELH